MVTIAGNISFYCIPARDGLLEGNVHPLSCQACSLSPASVPADVAVLFCSEKTHQLEWVHLSCLSNLRLCAETSEMAHHPDIANADVKLALAGLSKSLKSGRPGSPGTVLTVPFRFPPAFDFRTLKWRSIDASDCCDQVATEPISKTSSKDAPSEEVSGKESEDLGGGSGAASSQSPTERTKRVLRINTSAEAEPTPANDPKCNIVVPSIPKKEFKASSSSGGSSSTNQKDETKTVKGDGGMVESDSQHLTEAADPAAESNSQEQVTAGAKSAVDHELEAASVVCEEPKPKAPSERKDLLLRAGA
mmetsp:Transcript_70583/g.177949  ORF Transcript_70583/g.177949 Transcript_70583/m.177949 type:complete len:305 (-) Transcript_70583:195-1109(-)